MSATPDIMIEHPACQTSGVFQWDPCERGYGRILSQFAHEVDRVICFATIDADRGSVDRTEQQP
jgi:hypothetical protein